MVLQFDIRPKGSKGNGQWVQPRTDNAFGIRVARVFLVPENNFEVDIVARGDQKEQWRVQFSESKSAVHTAADLVEADDKSVRDVGE